ncbi:MAG: A/G-specific adenine glycosylase [Tannerellaceae bacterium]|nr:A/G-specific adenine glycosylase [Tannerellaceae bacterium]
METDTDFTISHTLIHWYHSNKRELPWRDTADPYIIWISEVILQQTRVDQGMGYFLRFTERFPDLSTLAEAEEDETLKYWQGLGYYSRARNMLAAARTIADSFGGVFPSRYEDILSLKGVGEYTAAAIASFAWNQPYPVVDGNVYRVLARLFAIDTPVNSFKGKKTFARIAALLMNPEKAGLHNQAMMEFGALQCVPRNPDCTPCPLSHQCMAYASGSVASFPVKPKKTSVRNRYFHYLHIVHEGDTWINRRSGNDIWKGLYEFPLLETEEAVDFAGLQKTEEFRRLLKDTGIRSVSIELQNVKHILSHQALYATFYKIEIEKGNEALESFVRIPCGSIGEYAVPRLVDIYLEKSGRKVAR